MTHLRTIQLCCASQHDAHNRLGSVATGGVERVMKDSFFSGIDFDALYEGKVQSPVFDECASWEVRQPGGFPVLFGCTVHPHTYTTCTEALLPNTRLITPQSLGAPWHCRVRDSLRIFHQTSTSAHRMLGMCTASWKGTKILTKVLSIHSDMLDMLGISHNPRSQQRSYIWNVRVPILRNT